jgi:ligand-binding sensor domain-containing protein
LNRFDGYSFKIYKHNPDDSNSIASTNISNLAQDYKGTIWIGAGEYLDFLDPVTDQLTHIDSLFNNKIPFPVESRWLLKKDKWGRYWYSNSKQGVFKYFTNEDSLVKVTGVPDGDAVINRHRITGMAFDSVNNVWVIDYTGKLVKFQNQTLKKTDSLNIGATYDNYYNLFIDADDNIWIYDLNNNMRGIKFIDIKLRKIITYNSHSTIKLNSDIIRE